MSASLLPWQISPVETLKRTLSSGRSVLDASDTGTGKTFVALFAAKEAGKRVAVLCPKSVIPAWGEAAAAVGVETLFVRNVESIKADKPERFLRKFGKQWQWKLPSDVELIVDEVHRFAGSSTDNGKILNAAPRPVAMLSRTAANSPIGLRAIGSQLGLTTWSQWWDWCRSYGCVAGTYGGIVFTGGVPEHKWARMGEIERGVWTAPYLDRLHRQIFHSGLGVRVKVEDIRREFPGMFPDNLIETVAVPIERQRALDEAYAEELRTLEREAESILPAITRSRQLAEYLKIPAMVEMAKDAVDQGMSVALFVNFRETLTQLIGALRDYVCVAIHGDQTAEEREAARQLFQDDRARVAAVMSQAGGIGLSLHDLHGVHPRLGLHSPGWSAVNLIQSLGRLPRAGAKTSVVQRILFAAGTVEERIRHRVQGKANAIDTLVDGDLRV